MALVGQEPISLQFLKKDRILVNIVQVISPAHFILKACPSVGISSESKKFFDVEECLQMFYSSVEVDSVLAFQSGSIAVAKVKDLKDHKNEAFYRVRVVSVLSGSKSFLYRVYLVDYGTERTVERDCLYPMEEDFRSLPYQAINFKLLDVQPLTLKQDPVELDFKLCKCEKWDISAENHMKLLIQTSTSQAIIVKGYQSNSFFGSIYLNFPDGQEKCINEEHVKNNFAGLVEDYAHETSSIDFILQHIDLDSQTQFQDETNDRTHRWVNSSDRLLSPVPCDSNVTSADDKCGGSSSPISVNGEATKQSNKKSSAMNKFMQLRNSVSSRVSVESSNSVSSDKKLETATIRASVSSPVSSKCQLRNGVSSPVMNCSTTLNGGSPTNASEVTKACVVSPPSNVSPKNSPSATNGISSSSVANGLPMLNGRNKNEVEMKESLIYSSPEKVRSEKSSSSTKNSPCASESSGMTKFMQMLRSSPRASNMSQCSENSSVEEVTVENGSTPKEESVGNVPTSKSETSHMVRLKAMSGSEKLKALRKRKSVTESSSLRINGSQSSSSSATNSVSVEADLTKDQMLPMANQTSETASPENKFTERFLQQMATRRRSSNSNLSAESNDDIANYIHYEEIYNKFLEEDKSPSPQRKPLVHRVSGNTDEVEETLNHYCDMDFSNRSLFEKQNVPALCFGRACAPTVLSISECGFPLSLIKILNNLKYPGLSSVQSAMWPNFMRNRCMAVIGSPHGGKTLGYVVAVAAKLLGEDYIDLKMHAGPVVVILCSSWKNVQTVHDMFSTLLRATKLKVVSFSDGNFKQKSRALYVGCDVLISVTSCLTRLLNCKLIMLDRLCHLIIDDGNYLLSQEQVKKIKDLLILIKDGLKNQKTSDHNLQIQLVLFSHRWTNAVAKFTERLLVNPVLIFTSLLESALYAQIKISAHVCSSNDQKNNKLLDILENGKKTIICTTDIETATEIHDHLKCENIRSTLITEKMEHYVSKDRIKDWKAVQSTSVPCCLVVTDSALINRNINSAAVLIHYDIPGNRLEFGRRFSYIAEHIKSEEIRPNCVCHILMTEENKEQSSDILEIIQRLKGTPPGELVDFAFEQKNAVKNSDKALCRNFKAFGNCQDSECKFRHFINEVMDKPSTFFTEGDIYGVVTHVIDASHFYVRVLKYLLPDKKQWTAATHTYTKIGFKLRKIYSDLANQIPITNAAVGEIGVIEQQNVFYRVKVLDVPTPENASKYKFLFLDEGWIKYYDTARLYQYSSSLNLPDFVAVEVFLSQIDTPDACSEWNPQATHFMESIIKGKQIKGKIALCIEKTLWLHPCSLKENLVFDNLFVSNLNKALINTDYAIANKQHLLSLKEACKDKIPIPIFVAAKKPEFNWDEQLFVQYAFLELDVMETVFVSSIVSPHKFYVQREKFISNLDDLNEDIQKLVKKKALQKCTNLQIGMHCIGKLSVDNMHYRAKVMSYDETTGQVQLYYVDFGDEGHISKHSVYSITPDLVIRLPFQAIECELARIDMPSDGWPTNTRDVMQNATRNEENCVLEVNLKALKKSNKEEAGHRYIVDVWWSDDLSLWSYLCEQFVAVPSQEPCSIPEIYEENFDENRSNSDKSEENFDEDLIEPDANTKRLQNEIAEEARLGDEDFSRIEEDEDCDLEDKEMFFEFVDKLARLQYPSFFAKTEQQATSRETKRNSGNIDKQSDSRTKNVVGQVVTKSRLQLWDDRRKILKASCEPQKCRPRTLWWQTKKRLYILISMLGIEIYELYIQKTSLKFKTSVHGLDYILELEFFDNVKDKKADDIKAEETDEIKAEKLIHGPSGLKIVLYKETSSKWDRLTKNDVKQAHITYNPEFIDVPEERDEMMESLDNIVATPLAQTCDNEDSDSDSEEIIPWKTIGDVRNKNNNNEDSDSEEIIPWKTIGDVRK